MRMHSQQTRWSLEAIRATNAGTMLEAIGFAPWKSAPAAVSPRLTSDPI